MVLGLWNVIAVGLLNVVAVYRDADCYCSLALDFCYGSRVADCYVSRAVDCYDSRGCEFCEFLSQ
jgi:hypothetical protein